MLISFPEDEYSPVDDPKPVYLPHEYSIDLEKLKTQEDILKVLKHIANKVELNLSEIQGIEEYVKPSLLMNYH